jgi:hypothetical protein
MRSLDEDVEFGRTSVRLNGEDRVRFNVNFDDEAFVLEKEEDAKELKKEDLTVHYYFITLSHLKYRNQKQARQLNNLQFILA